jgi:hypothetical protein
LSDQPLVFEGELISHNLGRARPPVRIAGQSSCTLERDGVRFEGFIPRTSPWARLKGLLESFGPPYGGLPASDAPLTYEVPWREVELIDSEFDQCSHPTGNVVFLLRDRELIFRPSDRPDVLLAATDRFVPRTPARRHAALIHDLVRPFLQIVAALAVVALALYLVGRWYVSAGRR